MGVGGEVVLREACCLLGVLEFGTWRREGSPHGSFRRGGAASVALPGWSGDCLAALLSWRAARGRAHAEISHSKFKKVVRDVLRNHWEEHICELDMAAPVLQKGVYEDVKGILKPREAASSVLSIGGEVVPASLGRVVWAKYF